MELNDYQTEVIDDLKTTCTGLIQTKCLIEPLLTIGKTNRQALAMKPSLIKILLLVYLMFV